jgi:TolB-like protein/DNA-binding winged helix-turn-helix (wHTH) protein
MVGDLLVEPTMARISRNLMTINLRPQVMELLVFLASNTGQVVSVEELLDKLWAGKVVTEGTLYNCIGELRHAIAGLDDTRPYIENIPKRGYRLTVPVEPLREPPTAPGVKVDIVPPINPGTKPRLVLALVGGLIVAVAAMSYLRGPREDISIAVLPFEDISPGGDQAYLGNGIADELRLELQRLDGLRIASRTSSIAYAQEDIKTIGKTLNVDSIIEGSIRKEGDNIRVTAQLTQAADGFAIWSESYNRKLENIFEMQEQIATSVAGALGVRFGVGTINAFRGAGTRNVEAYELYLQTQNYDWSRLAVEKKIRWLERAVELDPDYAAAWSFLGTLTLSTAWVALPHQAPDIVDRAYRLALRGVQLDPESATAHSNLAVIQQARLDWIEAERSHRRAIELRLDPLILDKYAWTLMRNGRTEYALKQWENVRALEPLGGERYSQEWHAFMAQGRVAEAQGIVDLQSAPSRFEDSIDIAFNEADPENLKAAILKMPEEYAAFTGLYGPVLAAFDSPGRVVSILRDVYRDKELQWTRKLHDIAMVAAYFGDTQFALKVKSEDIRGNVLRIAALWYPVMSEVRHLAEFKTLAAELNLVEYWRAYGWADYCRPLGDDDFECS